MALHLITGYAGTEHITSADQGAYNMGTYGEGEFVLDRGNKFGATVVTNNSITIADGEALMQGRFIKLPVGTTESVTIDNGASGMKRKDLIVLRYSKDAGTGIESVALAVKKGTPSSGTPSDPAVTTGAITDGTDLVNEMKLYRVNLDGLNIVSVDTLFSVKTTMVEYMDEYQLPVADANTLGGVKKGTNVNIASDGTLSVSTGGPLTKGVMGYQAGGGITADSGFLRLTKATSGQLGGVKIPSSKSITVNSDGELGLNIFEAEYDIKSLMSDLSIPVGASEKSFLISDSTVNGRLRKGWIMCVNIQTSYTTDKIVWMIRRAERVSSGFYITLRFINLDSTSRSISSAKIIYQYLE